MGDRKLIDKNNVADALTLLKLLISLLNKHKIKYYLDFGTLLGAVREKKFIRWDTNINITILNESDYNELPDILKELTIKYSISYSKFPSKFLYTPEKKVKKESKNRKFKTFVKRKILGKYLCKKMNFSNCEDKRKSFIYENLIYWTKKNIRMISIKNKEKNILMEMFLKYEKGNNLYWMAYDKIKRVPKESLGMSLKEVDFYGVKCSVPTNYDRYLTYLYGDWKIPHKEYHQEDGSSMLSEYRKRTSGDRRFIHQQNKDEMINLLKIIIKTFNKHNIEYYLDFGTLLGAVRDNGLMEWDDDVDISLTNENDFDKIPDILTEISSQYKCETNLYTFRDSQKEYSKYVDKYVEPREIEFTDADNYHIAKIRNRRVYDPNEANIILDIFFQYRDKKEMYWFMFGKVYRAPLSLLDTGLKKVDFHGIECNIPVDYDNYLGHIFGEDWRIPNPDWEEDNSPAMQNDYRGQIPEDRRFIHKKNRDEMIHLFKVVDAVLNFYDIKYYLDFGTLIGAVREKGFIPWDDDIDISIINERDFIKLPMVIDRIKKTYGYDSNLYTLEHAQQVYELSEKLYVKPHKLMFTDKRNYQVAIIKSNKNWIPGKGNAVIDIFCKYKYEKSLYWMAFGKEYNMPSKPLEKGFMEIDFYGVTCLIPTAHDEYLSGHYGTNWKIPNETWDQKDSNAMMDIYKDN